MATTIFTLDGYGYTGFLPLTTIGQTVGTAPRTYVPIPYNNYVGNSLPNIIAAAALLDEYLHNDFFATPQVVLGISMGTQVAYKWLRDYGPTSDISPSQVSFMLLANPENAVSGSSVFAPGVFDIQGGYGGLGISNSTPYTVVNYTRQYDGVADWPNLPSPSQLAVLNATLGIGLIHINYFGVGLSDANLVHYVVNNITYQFSPTYPMPLAQMSSLNLVDQQTQDNLNRTTVELSYDRTMYNAGPLPTIPPRPVRPSYPALAATVSLTNADRRIYDPSY